MGIVGLNGSPAHLHARLGGLRQGGCQVSQLVLSLAPALTLRRCTAPPPRPRDRKAPAGTHQMSEHLFTQLYRGQVSIRTWLRWCWARGVPSRAVQDRYTGRVQAHPAPVAQTSSPSWGTQFPVLFDPQGHPTRKKARFPTPVEETTFERGGNHSHSGKRDQCFL